jgi:translocation and assembly module TamA
MNNTSVRWVSIAKAFIVLIFLSECSPTFFLFNAEAGVTVKVTVDGVNGDMKKNVLAYLSLEQQKEHPDLTPGLINKLHEKAPDEIRKALQSFGYYNPVIQRNLMYKDAAWHAVYTIAPGNPVIIDVLDVRITGEGSKDESFIKHSEALPLKKGNTMNHQHYEEAKKLLYDWAAKSGYVKARMIESRVDVYSEENTAVIKLHFDTGPQYYFGDVQLVENTFNPEFIMRFIPFKKGDLYTLSRLLKLQNALNDSDYFESIEVTPLTEDAKDRKIPIKVTLTPRKKNKYTFGLGYGTDTGIRGGTGWGNRRLNREGHRMKADLRLSEIKSSFTSEYSVPLQDPRTDTFVCKAGWLKENTKTSDSETYFGGARYTHMRHAWKESVYTTYEQERFDVGEDSGRSTLLIPGVSWTRISPITLSTLRQGSRLFLDIRGADESMLSDTSFLQFQMQAKYIQGITPLSRIILRAEGGGSFVDKFSVLPPSVRFFAGGDNSVRGYAYNSLGPEDNQGDVIGGKHLLVGSIEFEHQIKGAWSAAVFYVVGNAIDDLSDRLKKGAGFGIRWKSPVGPIRVDLAFPIDKSDRSWRIHFNIGPDL